MAKEKAQWAGRSMDVYMTRGASGRFAPVLSIKAIEQERITYAVLTPDRADEIAVQLQDYAARARKANAKKEMTE